MLGQERDQADGRLSADVIDLLTTGGAVVDGSSFAMFCAAKISSGSPVVLENDLGGSCNHRQRCAVTQSERSFW